MDNMLTEGELRRRRREFHALAGQIETEPRGREAIRYGLDGPQGRQLYESCFDQELLDLLRERAAALGRSPAQNEVHWTCRTYLRARFKNWPNALRAARRSAGRSPSPSAGGFRMPAAPGPMPSISWVWSPIAPADPFPSAPPSTGQPICEVSFWISPL